MTGKPLCSTCKTKDACIVSGTCHADVPTCSEGVSYCGQPGYIRCSKHARQRFHTGYVPPEGVDVKLRNPKGVAAKFKVSASLVPEIATIELAQAFRNGALKYGPFNWRVEPIATSVYLDAMERHILLYRAGQDVASDSKLSHLTHIMSGCAILLDAQLQGSVTDDRHKWADPDQLELILDQHKETNEQA